MKPTQHDQAGRRQEDDLPIMYWHADKPNKNQDDIEDVIDFMLAFAIIVAFIVVFMFAFGRFA